MTEKEKNEILEILDSIPTEFRIIENRINTEKIEEYYKLSEPNSKKEADINHFEKEKLVKLSKQGDVKSYRTIEKTIKDTADKDLIDFAFVALKFARMNLENLLIDEPIGFISTGLGGKENKLRYFFAIKTNGETEKIQEAKILSELEKICDSSESEIESLENFGNYALIKILVPMEQAIGNIIDSLTIKCDFLEKNYFCTNVERPSKELLEKWTNNELE